MSLQTTAIVPLTPLVPFVPAVPLVPDVPAYTTLPTISSPLTECVNIKLFISVLVLLVLEGVSTYRMILRVSELHVCVVCGVE